MAAHLITLETGRRRVVQMRESPDKDRHPLAETFACPMCHRQTTLEKTLLVAGRRLCSGCARTWYEDDDEETGKKKP